MGDVFTFLVLLHFSTAPALLTYWANVTATALSGYLKAYGWRFWTKVAYYRLIFNLSCCAISVSAMGAVQVWVGGLSLSPSAAFLGSVGAITVVWFLLNTGTLSLAVALSTGRSFFRVWTDGLGLYLLNFAGSGAAAGLITAYFETASFPVLVLSLPAAIVVYHLYLFYIEKFEQTESHIGQLNKVYLQTIEAMAMAVDAKDRYTHGHIRRVQVLATELAGRAGIKTENEILALKAGALLHDIGKIAIPEYILNKPTALTSSEFEKMKIHPVVGANLLKNIEFPYPVVPAVRSHHERWDGSGYPDGLIGEQIPLSARILALVDCYDALTTDRPYRSPMTRDQIEAFFRKESGRAYDPAIVSLFLENLDQLEEAGRQASVPSPDIWGIRFNDDEKEASNKVRLLEKVQPTIVYSRALDGANAGIQRDLWSMFEFVQAHIEGLSQSDILAFMGNKLLNILTFDAAVFFIADLEKGRIEARHVAGQESRDLLGMSSRLEQKLSGWVAANNQALCNLPPFPDFLEYPKLSGRFLMSAIVPINRRGVILGAISVYRTTNLKFDEEAFRRLELVAAQSAIALSKIESSKNAPLWMADETTGLPSSLQLHIMFEPIATDAIRYEYPLSLLAIRLDDARLQGRKVGKAATNQALRAATGHLRSQLRDTDLLVRNDLDEFLVLSPGANRDQAESLKSRLQDALDRCRVEVRPNLTISLGVSIGISIYPEDATLLNSMVVIAETRLEDDKELRSAVRHKVRAQNRD